MEYAEPDGKLNVVHLDDNLYKYLQYRVAEEKVLAKGMCVHGVDHRLFPLWNNLSDKQREFCNDHGI